MSRRPALVFGLPLITLCLVLFTQAFADVEPPATSLYQGMEWRLVGPFRGGWSTMAVGVPSEPNTFYFGGADGGVWKTVDAGLTWKPEFQQGDSLSIGALAVAPSNPNIIYIGTGQPEQSRYDTVEGAGVFRSDDGGATWRLLGLSDTRHIGRIWVDPRNPDVVTVAALGHVFGPNDERGVFRSEDGGKHWQKVLFVDANTGAIDLAADPAQPDVMFAATWQGREWPWFAYYIPQQGPGSGIWKSTDGGKTWAKLSGGGLPGGSLGRIGLAVAPGTNDQRVYALIESSDDKQTALYRSDDGGANWKSMGHDELVSGYFDRMAVDPKDPDTLYVMNRSVAKSTDGGKTFEWFKGAPGGDDYHFIWINPDDDTHMVVASDQGTSVSIDGGKSWSSWYNQPTGQFYHVTTDDRFPYHIYSGQQDSGTVEAESASDYGELTFRDWNSVGGDERSYVFPDKDPNIVYVGGLGGHISRFDKTTGQVQNISAWPITDYGKRPTTVKYRYNWFYPVVADPHKAHVIYLGAQYVFKSTDEGTHWSIISPDLTGADPHSPDAAGCDGNDLKFAQAKACGYGVIFSIAPSPAKDGVIWTGADDGVVELSRDGGKHWADVSPKDMPAYGRVNQVEASPTDPATAYVAVDIHRQDVFKPFAFRTHDYGKTWTAITGGLPASEFVYVVRQDLKNPKVLYAGTNRGVYVSFDDGDAWEPLQNGLPAVRVRDLTLHGDDLIAATHGRGLWVMDDVASLRQVAQAKTDGPILFQPAVAVRVRRDENKDTPLPPEEPAGQNPPEGAIIDYWLPKDVAGPVKLEIVDAAGKPVRSYASDAPQTKMETDLYFNSAWLTPPETLPAEAGGHRFVWDLRYPRPLALSYDYSIAAVYGRGGDVLPEGPLVLPGKYTVKLTAGGKTYSQPLEVTLDPRVSAKDAKTALPAQLKFAEQIGESMRQSYTAHEEIAKLRADIAKLTPELGAASDLAKSVAAFDAKAEQLESKAKDRKNLRSINGGLAGLAAEIDDGDRTPPAQYHQAYEVYAGNLKEAMKQWEALRNSELPALDAALKAHSLAPLEVTGP